MPVAGVPEFERFFREAASLHVDKDDLKRYVGFLDHKVSDLLLRGTANAKANGRDVMETWDLPVTNGLQESIHDYDQIDAELGLRWFIEPLVKRPPLDVTLSEEAEADLPHVAGGLSVALARALVVIDPGLRNPSTEHWDRAFRIFNLLL
jgi:hypothetical protein